MLIWWKVISCGDQSAKEKFVFAQRIIICMDSEKKVWARKQKKVKGSKEGTQFGRHMAKRKKEVNVRRKLNCQKVNQAFLEGIGHSRGDQSTEDISCHAKPRTLHTWGWQCLKKQMAEAVWLPKTWGSQIQKQQQSQKRGHVIFQVERRREILGYPGSKLHKPNQFPNKKGWSQPLCSRFKMLFTSDVETLTLYRAPHHHYHAAYAWQELWAWQGVSREHTAPKLWVSCEGISIRLTLLDFLPCWSCVSVCMCVCACAHIQSRLALCNPMYCSPPGSCVHGIFQARILEWVAISFSRESSWPRGRAHVSCISYTGRRIL